MRVVEVKMVNHGSYSNEMRRHLDLCSIEAIWDYDGDEDQSKLSVRLSCGTDWILSFGSPKEVGEFRQRWIDLLNSMGSQPSVPSAPKAKMGRPPGSKNKVKPAEVEGAGVQ